MEKTSKKKVKKKSKSESKKQPKCVCQGTSKSYIKDDPKINSK